jgi:hypothetical protein
VDCQQGCRCLAEGEDHGLAFGDVGSIAWAAVAPHPVYVVLLAFWRSWGDEISSSESAGVVDSGLPAVPTVCRLVAVQKFMLSNRSSMQMSGWGHRAALCHALLDGVGLSCLPSGVVHWSLLNYAQDHVPHLACPFLVQFVHETSCHYAC